MHQILQTLCSFSPMACTSGGGGEIFHTEDSPDLGGWGLSGEREAEINERSPSQDCETSGFEHRRHRKSSITLRNNSGFAVTSFSF